MARTHYKSYRLYIVTGVIAAITACQVNDAQQNSPAIVEEANPEITQKTVNPEAVVNFNQQLSFSKQDLADRLGIDIDNIRVIAARHITWRSGALGCPKPGMSYTEAMVPGIYVLLDADGKLYGYHAQENQQPFYCPVGQAIIPDSIQQEDLA